ncbi:prepilin-type N-terminal cleavage/methylation domain-containing protein [Candidatus Kaiserbacteria bacterium]|nr:prepilin-type N-terminal cleavage/methylation domain-containing protein [Candidatus Kaiserbacteria bacterium]MCB9818414.1 prepilin-type N-terminal cleavage/methylation domain-containing protein [Candidatus Nomurabacteria bacterium]
MSWNFLASYNKTADVRNYKAQAGFGLVELLVSISIVVIVASIILTKQSTFNSSVLLRGQAYEVALRAREVQLSAVSATNDAASDFRSVLGLHFDVTNGNEGGYKIFRDANLDGFYSGSGEEYDVQGQLDNRFEIREIRVIDGGGTSVENDLSIIFVRPNFDARFFVDAGQANEKTQATAEIDVARRGIVGTGNEVLRTVVITSTGQISVK